MQNQPGALGQGGRSSPAGSGHGAFSGRDFRLAGFVLVKNLLLFIAVSGTGTDGAVLGVIYRTAGGLIMAAILAGTVYIFYVMLVWQKAYNLFNVSFKNKYVLDTIRQLPGFSELRYNSQGGFTRQELQRFNLLPSCMITYYKASDELRGILDGTRFRASSVSVGKRASGCRSLPDIVFEGQIIGFETFDSQKAVPVIFRSWTGSFGMIWQKRRVPSPFRRRVKPSTPGSPYSPRRNTTPSTS